MDVRGLGWSQIKSGLIVVTSYMFEVGSLKGSPRSIVMIGERYGFTRRLFGDILRVVQYV